jgi:hypothetical protein
MLKPYGYEIAFGFLVGALASSIFWTALLSPLQPPYSTENQQGTKGTYKEAAKVSADDRIADYTEWLAVLTGGRVIVAAIQIGFLIRTDKTARISADAAKQSAHATKESAAAAQASVQLAIAKQRAYIFAEVIGNNARAWKNGERFAWE